MCECSELEYNKLDWRYIGPWLYDGCLFFAASAIALTKRELHFAYSHMRVSFVSVYVSRCNMNLLFFCMLSLIPRLGTGKKVLRFNHISTWLTFTQWIWAREESITHCFCAWNVNCNDMPKKDTSGKKGNETAFSFRIVTDRSTRKDIKIKLSNLNHIVCSLNRKKRKKIVEYAPFCYQ